MTLMLIEQPKVAWHYTAEHSVSSILREGLRVVKVQNQELLDAGIYNGTCVFLRPQHGKAQAGQVIDRAIALAAWKIALLRVEYYEDETHHFVNGSTFVFTHEGQIGPHSTSNRSLIYHTKEPMTVLIKKIPPKRLRVVATFDLLELLEWKEEEVCDKQT